MRWEEPHHPGPGLQLERHNNPHSPTLQHDLPLQPHLHPLPRAVGSRDRVTHAAARSRSTTPTTCAASTSSGCSAAADLGPDPRRHASPPGSPAAIFLGAGDRRRAPPLGVVLISLLIVFAIADSRAADAFFQRLRPAARPRTRRPRAAAADDAAAAQGRRPLRRAHPLRPDRRRRRRHPRSLSPTRKRAATATATSRPTTTATPSAWSTVPECVPHRARALLPAQVRPARPGELRGRLPRLQRAGQAGERGARREVRDLRHQEPGRRSGCASSSPPPSSSG